MAIDDKRARVEATAGLLVLGGVGLGLAARAGGDGGSSTVAAMAALAAMAAVTWVRANKRGIPGIVLLALGGLPALVALMSADATTPVDAHMALLARGTLLSSALLAACAVSGAIMTVRTGHFDPRRVGIGGGAALVGIAAVLAVRGKFGLSGPLADTPLLYASILGVLAAGLSAARVGRVTGASRHFALGFVASVAAVILAGIGAEHLIGATNGNDLADLDRALDALPGRRHGTVASMGVVAAAYLVGAVTHLGTLGAGYSWGGIFGGAIALGLLGTMAGSLDNSLSERSSHLAFRQVPGIELVESPAAAEHGRVRQRCQGALVFFEHDATAWFHPPDRASELVKYEAGALEGQDVLVVADARVPAADLLSVLEWEKAKSLSLAVRAPGATPPSLGGWGAWLEQGPPCVDVSIDASEALGDRLAEGAKGDSAAWMVLVEGAEMRYFATPLPSFIHSGPVGSIEKAVRGSDAGTAPGLAPRDVIVMVQGTPSLSALLEARRAVVPSSVGCDGCGWEPPRIHLSRHYDQAKRTADALEPPTPPDIPWDSVDAPTLRDLEVPKELSALAPFVPVGTSMEFVETRKGSAEEIRRLTLVRTAAAFECKVTVTGAEEQECAAGTPHMAALYAMLRQAKVDLVERTKKPPPRRIGPFFERYLEVKWPGPPPGGEEKQLRIEMNTVAEKSLPTWKYAVWLFRDAITAASKKD